MCIVISIANQKGGVGKTTITFNIGGILSEQRKNVLLIDLDAQCNLSNTLLENFHKIEKSAFDLIVNDNVNVEEIIFKTKFPLLSIIPSSSLMSGIDKRLSAEWDPQFLLKDKLESIKEDFEFIIIDCPPSLGLATTSGLICSNYVIIPLNMDEYSFMGNSKIYQLVQKVKKRMNPEIDILGYLINKLDTRRNLEKAYFKYLNNEYDNVFRTFIKVSVKYPESILVKKPINYFLSNSEQAEIFRNLVLEIIERCQKKDLSKKSEIITKQCL